MKKKIPDITITITQSVTVPYIAIRASWRSQDGTQRYQQVVLHEDEMISAVRQRVIDQIINEIIMIEETLYG